MTTTAGKGRSGEVYRYYACRNRARKTEDRCEHPRLSAPEVEELVISRVRHVCADRAMRAQIAERMRVAEPGMAARIQEQRAEAEATRLALRAEADKLMRSLGHEASGRASHLLAERIGAIEAELEPVHARIAQLDAQMQALQRAAEQANRGRLPAAAERRAAVAVRSTAQTIRILEVFDEAWAAFSAAERQELVLILVEKVVVNEPAGKLDIVFHDLGGPFDAAGDGASEVALEATTEETPA
jgi:hypothetical protein